MGRRPGLATDGVRTSANAGRNEHELMVSSRTRRSSKASASVGCRRRAHPLGRAAASQRNLDGDGPGVDEEQRRQWRLPRTRVRFFAVAMNSSSCDTSRKPKKVQRSSLGRPVRVPSAPCAGATVVVGVEAYPTITRRVNAATNNASTKSPVTDSIAASHAPLLAM
jgi:hypothetical protein